jgi:hypothetical protein
VDLEVEERKVEEKALDRRLKLKKKLVEKDFGLVLVLLQDRGLE